MAGNAQKAQQRRHFIFIHVRTPALMQRQDPETSPLEFPAPIAVHFFQHFRQAFLIEQGPVSGYDYRGQGLVVQRGDERAG